MIVIDGTNTPMGRVGVLAAKQSLRGEVVRVVNCNKIIITGNKENILEEFLETRRRHGSSQKGPIINKTSPEKIVKRCIRGMLPSHKEGRGRVAFKNIMCYNEVPKELEAEKMIKIETTKKIKFSMLKDFTKQ